MKSFVDAGYAAEGAAKDFTLDRRQLRARSIDEFWTLSMGSEFAFRQIALMNEWIEQTIADLKKSGVQYNSYAEWFERTGSENYYDALQACAEGIAKNLDHLDWLNEKLNDWERLAGY